MSVVPTSQEHRSQNDEEPGVLGPHELYPGQFGVWMPKTPDLRFPQEAQGPLPTDRVCSALCHQPRLPSGALPSHLNAPGPHRGPRDTWLSPEPAMRPRTQQECPSQPEFLG